MTDIMKQQRARAAVKLALEEDVGTGDVTSLALVDPKARATGQIYSRVPCVVAGATVARAVLKAVDPRLKVTILKQDGETVKPEEPILIFEGKAQSILGAERTALNFIQRLSGVATMTHKYVRHCNSHA